VAGDDDIREFMRTTVLRLERMGREQWRELSRMNDVLERNTDELERQGREGREEARAGREALWRMIDRLDCLDPPPAGV
jgi:hypothetical protein